MEASFTLAVVGLDAHIFKNLLKANYSTIFTYVRKLKSYLEIYISCLGVSSMLYSMANRVSAEEREERGKKLMKKLLGRSFYRAILGAISMSV